MKLKTIKVDKDTLDQEVDKLINDVAEFMEGHDRPRKSSNINT